jgi:hypothetical protein
MPSHLKAINFYAQLINTKSNFCAAAVCIVLDTRLGCLDNDLKSDSEPQMIIDAVQVLHECLYETETQISF